MSKKREAIEHVKHALRLLERAKHGGVGVTLPTTADEWNDNERPLNEWEAIGGAKFVLGLALQALGEKRPGELIDGRS